METMDNQTKALDRYLSPVDVWAMAFGCMVGWGVFAMPGMTFLPVAGPAGTVIALLTGMGIMLVIARNFTFLMGRTSITGGVYSYTKEAFGREHAFISSWFLCLSYLTIVFLNGTALFFVARTLFSDVVQKGTHYEIAGNTVYIGETVISAMILAGVGFLFIAAKAVLQKLQTLLSLLLFAGIVITALFCIPHAISGGAAAEFGTRTLNRGYAVFSLVILAPWAFVGFEATSFDTAHFRFAFRKSKKIIVAAILMTAFAYASMALVSAAAVPDGFESWQAYITGLDTLSGVESVPTFHAAKAIMGTPGLVIMTVTAICSILTGIIGGYRATTRILATMSEDRILSEKFSKTTYTIVFVMILSIVLSLFGRNTLNWFVDLTSFGAIAGFGYTSAAAYKIAKTEGNSRIQVTGMAGAIVSGVFVIVQMVPRLAAMEAMGAEAFLLLSLWCLLGFIFYWRTVTRGTLAEYSDMSTSGVVLFALLLYCALMWLGKYLMEGTSAEEIKHILVCGGIVLMVIVFVGLSVMLYVQKRVREKHEAAEREKIHAVESSLAKSQFLFNMSHDIRTPMNAILGYTMLARKEEASPEVQDYLEKIENSGQHLLALINDILEMSRIESGKVELELVPCDLISVFEGMRDLFAEQMKQKHIDYQIHAGQIRNRYVWCDRKNLNRILLNILSNAYKFTPEGGTVSASLWEAGTGEDGYISYEIRVRDTGIGMSKEFADRMFNAFERERTSTVSGIEGTGLGLAITKSLVDLMGGTIEVLTAPGSGTEIIIRLKWKPAEEADRKELREETGRVVFRNDGNAGADAAGKSGSGSEEQGVSHKADTYDFSGKRILLVEDNLINLEIACMILKQAGFTVETAENGQVAVNMVNAAKPGYYDAVLMDIQMPVMDGYEATRQIRALPDEGRAGVPILAMTANAFKEDEQAAREAGMQGHIAKPIDVTVLLNSLRDVLFGVGEQISH